MKTSIALALCISVALAHGKDLEFGGITFRLPEKGAGVSVVEGGKAWRIFHTNLNFSDENARRAAIIEWTVPNRIEKLDTLPGRTAYRVTYTVRGTDALQFSVVYRFFDGVPGVSATEELMALKPVRIHLWNMTTAYGDEKNRFVYDAGFKTKEGSIFYAAYPKPLSRTEGTLLETGKSMTMTHVAGCVRRDGDAEKIAGLRARVLFDGRDGPVVVSRLARPAKGGSPDWDAVPIAAERRDTRDYRPLASNQWKGPDDL